MIKRRALGEQIAAAGLVAAVLGTRKGLAEGKQIEVGMLLYPQLTLQPANRAKRRNAAGENR
jgi:hypothetical protein